MRQVVVNRAILFAALLSILIVREADGYYENGNKLTEACNANATENAAAAFQEGLCFGYALGVLDTLVDQTKAFCVPQGPQGVKLQQVVDLVRLYLRTHPELRHLPAAALVVAALKEKFPCN
jgi:hypothetical protein